MHADPVGFHGNDQIRILVLYLGNISSLGLAGAEPSTAGAQRGKADDQQDKYIAHHSVFCFLHFFVMA